MFSIKNLDYSLASRNVIAASLPLRCSWLHAARDTPVKQNYVWTHKCVVAQITAAQSAAKQPWDMLSGDYTASPLKGEFAMLTSPFSHLDDCMLTIKQASE